MSSLRQTMEAGVVDMASNDGAMGVVVERGEGVEGVEGRLPSTAITTELDKIASHMARIEADVKRIDDTFRSIEQSKRHEDYTCGLRTKKASEALYHRIGDVRMEVGEVQRMHQLATALRRLGGCEKPQHECKALIDRMRAALVRAERHAADAQEEGYSILQVVAGRMLDKDGNRKHIQSEVSAILGRDAPS